MPRSANYIPAYRLYKRTGQAVVTLAGRDHYLGPYESAASREGYNRIIAEWFAAGRPQIALIATPAAAAPSVEDIIAAFWMHARVYYRDKDGQPTPEMQSFRDVLGPLRRLCGTTVATRFGPLALQACQSQMIRDGLSRKTINRRVGRIRHVFKWAVSRELLPSSVFESLRTVAGLQRGRSEAKESPAVKPVAEPHVMAVIANAGRVVAAMIELQLITGMRSGELVIMRTGDIDRSGRAWTYRPSRHKTEHRGHDRVVYIDRRGQEILQPFLQMDCNAYLFSPAAAERERRAALSAARRTPLSCGNRPGTNRIRKPRREPGEKYDVKSYHRAVRTACDRAFPVPAGLTAEAVKAFKKSNRFHPHQLRHTAATRFRRDSNLDTARALLGQKTIQAAEIYAEQDMDRAREFMERVG